MQLGQLLSILGSSEDVLGRLDGRVCKGHRDDLTLISYFKFVLYFPIWRIELEF